MSFWEKLKDIYFGLKIRFGYGKKPSVEPYLEKMEKQEEQND